MSEQDQNIPEDFDSQSEPETESSSDDAGAAASEALESAQDALRELQDGATPLDLPNLAVGGAESAAAGIELLSDVTVNVKIELGRTRMLVEDVLKLGDGAVVELDKLAGDPVDIYVNDRPIARGEVLVLNDNFCVRINEILQNPFTEEARAEAARVEGARTEEK